MKTVVLIIFSLILCLNLTGGAVKDFNASIKKGGYFEYSVSSNENNYVILETKEDMNNYIESIINKLDTTILPSEYWQEQVNSIKDYYKCYNEKFFKNNNLIIALVDSGSGSCRYEVKNLRAEEDNLKIYINRIAPMAMTMDYVQWVLTLELSKKVYDVSSVEIVLINL